MTETINIPRANGSTSYGSTFKSPVESKLDDIGKRLDKIDRRMVEINENVSEIGRDLAVMRSEIIRLLTSH